MSEGKSRCWVGWEEFRRLLMVRCSDKYAVCKYDPKLRTSTNIIKYALNEPELENRVIVIPIHIACDKTNKTRKDWVGLILNRSVNKSIEAIYIDRLKREVDEYVLVGLRDNGIEDFRVISDEEQLGNKCGPWFTFENVGMKEGTNLAEVVEQLTSHDCDKYVIVECGEEGVEDYDVVVRQALDHLKSLSKPVVIPFNASPIANRIYQVSHWVCLVIKSNSSGNLEAVYIDYLGLPMNASLADALERNEVFVADVYRDQSMRRHDNLNDCGPWAVYNVNYLLNCGTLPDDIQEHTLRQHQLTLNALMRPRPKTTHEFIKEKDLKKLKEIADKIKAYENGDLDWKSTLAAVGELAAQIARNDQRDKEKKWIRNKYGYIKGDKGIVTDNRIPFDKLAHLKHIFTDQELMGRVSFEDGVGEDLSRLRRKILHILRVENYIAKDLDAADGASGDAPFSILNIVELSSHYYEILVYRLFKREICDWDSIDFNERNDRYYFARKFCLLGENFKDVIDGMDKEVNDVVNAFHQILEVRNLLIHNCGLIAHGHKQDNERITSVIRNLKEHFDAMVSDGQSAFDYAYTRAKELLDDSTSLLNYLLGENVKLTLDKVVLEAREIIEDLERNSGDKQLRRAKNQLKASNKQYQAKLKTVIEKDINYPDVLDIEHKDSIIRCCEIRQIKKGQMKTGKDKDKKDANLKLGDRLGFLVDQYQYFRTILNEIVTKFEELWRKTEVEKLIVNAFEILQEDSNLGLDPSNPDEEVDMKLKKIDETYQGCINTLTEGDRIGYPAAVDRKHIDAIIQVSKRHQENSSEFMCPPEFFKMKNLIKDVKIFNYFEQLWFFLFSEDYRLLSRCIEEVGLSDRRMSKYKYIFQYVLIAIDQSIIDVETHVQSIMTSSQNDQNLNHLLKIFGSQFMKKETRLSKDARSAGLAHNLQSFNLQDFYQKIPSSLSVTSVLESFNPLLNKEDSSLSADELNVIGTNLFKNGLYMDAIEYLERSLKRFEDHPDEGEKHESHSDFLKCTGKSRNVLLTHFFIIMSLLSSGQSELFCSRLDEIVQAIDETKLSTCDNNDVKENVCAIYFLIGCNLYGKGDQEKGLKLIEKADDLYEILAIRMIRGLVYLMRGRLEEGMKLFSCVLQDPLLQMDCCSDLKMSLTDLLAVAKEENLDNKEVMEKADNRIYEMDKFFEKDVEYLKYLDNSKYFLFVLLAMFNKFEVVFKNGFSKGITGDNLDKLKKIDEKFQGLLETFDEDCTTEPLVTIFWLLLCRGYCSVYTGDNLDLDNGGNYLNKARQYFNMSTERKIPTSFPMFGGFAIATYLRLGDFDTKEQDFHKPAVKNLFEAYDNYIVLSRENTNVRLRIECLLSALGLSEQYNYRRGHTLFTLGQEYFRIAQTYYDSICALFKQEYSKIAIINFNEAVLCLESIDLNDNKEENNFPEVKFFLGQCYYFIACLTHELRLLKTSRNCFNDLLSLSLSESRNDEVAVQLENIGNMMYSINEALQLILKDSADSPHEANDFLIEYLNKVWNITISFEGGRLTWNYEGRLSIDELKSKIQIELGYIEEEY